MRVRRVWLDNSWVGRCLVGRCPVCGLFLACASFLFYPFLATSLTRRASFGHRQWEPLGVNHMNPNSLSESYSLSLFLTLSLFHSQSLSLFLSLCLVLSLSGIGTLSSPRASPPHRTHGLWLWPHRCRAPSPPRHLTHSPGGGVVCRAGAVWRGWRAGGARAVVYSQGREGRAPVAEEGTGRQRGSGIVDWEGARKQPKVCRSLSLQPLPSSPTPYMVVYFCEDESVSPRCYF